MKCSRCGAGMSFLWFETLCPKCVDADLKQQKEDERRRRERLREEEENTLQAAAAVIVSTTPNLDGWRVERYIGIESIECVIGTGLFSEITTDFQDFFGRRSSAFEKKLQTAKKNAFDALKYLAAQKGGNAVIGIDMDYTEFSGNRIGLIVTPSSVALLW